VRTHPVRRIAALAALAAVLAAAGCGRSATQSAAASSPPSGERRFPLTGVVVSVDAAKKVLVVRHDEVKGYMPAMTMEFAVSAGDAATAKPGESIRADFVVGPGDDLRLENLWPDDKAARDSVEAGARMLRQDTLAKGGQAYREVGDAVPDFVLYDQNGRVVDSARFRGKQVMLNFIYTRCPVANMCPLSTSKMMATQKLAREAGVSNIEFVSVTMDPAHDTPGVLRDYADQRGIDTTNFSFLTGPEPTIRDLLTQFGVIAEFKGELLDHTLATLLVDEKGRVAWRADGSQWQPKEFVERMRK
jgi:protein SCO1/2